ncbi:MAG: CPBP family intramembrane metalloprotease [Lachnospiraceae bacterium]|nr:CPBP family intramembrane metalloprotease [Lachnospiraceae bacterium]
MKGFISKHPVIIMIGLVVIAQLGIKIRIGEGVWGQIPIRVVLGIVILGILYTVAGKELFTWQKKSGRYGLIRSIYILIFPIVSFVMTIGLGALVGEVEIAKNWLSLSVAYLVYTLVIGFFEEGLFRGIITNGFVKIMPKTKAGLFGAIVISGLFFGFMHVWENLFDIGGNPLVVISQMTSKILVTGSVGILLAAIYMKTKNIWICMIIHALNDLFVMLILAFMGLEISSIQYVDATATMDMSAVTMEIIGALVVGLPNIIISYRITRKLEPTECVIWK